MPDVKFSNLYPYTDFHELNLDWVIKEVKFWSERVGKSIQKIELTGTVGLVDTYTITYSDETTSTFDVTNGNGIASVAKTGTAGLVDTYTITFQDGSTTTFEVHNGTASIDDTLTLQGYAADAKATGDAIKSTNDLLSQLYAPGTNLLDTSKITPNTYINIDGSSTPSLNFSVTDYIPVSAGQTIYFWSRRTDTFYYLFDARFLCAYDATKTAMPAAGGTWVSGQYAVPAGVAFIRLSISNTYLSSWDNFYVGTLPVDEYAKYEPYGTVHPIDDFYYIVRSGESILAGVHFCYDHNIKNIMIEAGIYDIISEYENYYGASYFDDYVDYTQDLFDAGIWLHDITVKFSPGAKVVCKYTGNNANVPANFSAFATGNNVVLDGLVLDAENLRYGIHADYNSGTGLTFFEVKNCDLKHYKNATSIQAIGSGLGRHVMWTIQDTIFRSNGGNHIVFRIHNNVNSDALSKVVIKNCYIDGDGYFQFNSYSTSTDFSIIQVCGCSYKNVPLVAKETPESNDNITLIAWNNEIRS